MNCRIWNKFQSTPPCGGRQRNSAKNTGSNGFNPRPRAGGDFGNITDSAISGVSIHAPVRGATTVPRWNYYYAVFQSTPPCGGRQCLRLAPWNEDPFQSTPPCGGRPTRGRMGGLYTVVSIHAPVRGATRAWWKLRFGKNVSIHAPVRGATVDSQLAGSVSGVSIHAPVRGATHTNPRKTKMRKVSIHAPVRGATSLLFGCLDTLDSFNPRPRAGGDVISDKCEGHQWRFQSTPPCGGRRSIRWIIGDECWFQSTPPCGGRPGRGIDAFVYHRFNPRPRAGGDYLDLDLTLPLRVSIHAPVRGATLTLTLNPHTVTSFNPRPRAGGDYPLLNYTHKKETVSIHAPVRGATPFAACP